MTVEKSPTSNALVVYTPSLIERLRKEADSTYDKNGFHVSTYKSKQGPYEYDKKSRFWTNIEVADLRACASGCYIAFSTFSPPLGNGRVLYSSKLDIELILSRLEEITQKSDSSLSHLVDQSDENKSTAIVLKYPSYAPSGFYWPHANFATALYFAHAQKWEGSLNKTSDDSDSNGASSSCETHSDAVDTTSYENPSESFDSDSNELSLVERIIYLGKKGDETLKQQVISFEDKDEVIQ